MTASVFGMKHSLDQMDMGQPKRQRTDPQQPVPVSEIRQIGLQQTDPTAVDNWVSDQLKLTIELKKANQIKLRKKLEENNISCKELQKIANFGLNIYESEKSRDTIFEQVLENYIYLKKKNVQNAELERNSQMIHTLFSNFFVRFGTEINEKLLKSAIDAELPELAKNLLDYFVTIFYKKMDPQVRSGQMRESIRRECALNDMSMLIKKPDAEGETLFSYALDKEYFDLADLLIWYGADLNQKDENGTPLVMEKYSKNKAAISEYLIEHGANINIQDKKGYVPLYLAVIYGKKDMLRCLVELGADINIQTHSGKTSLHRAVINEKEEMVKYLVKDCHANVNIQDNHLNTPLHWAVFYNNINIVKSLVENGADVNIENKQGMTPIDVANNMTSIDSNDNIVKYLLEKGAVARQIKAKIVFPADSDEELSEADSLEENELSGDEIDAIFSDSEENESSEDESVASDVTLEDYSSEENELY